MHCIFLILWMRVKFSDFMAEQDKMPSFVIYNYSAVFNMALITSTSILALPSMTSHAIICCMLLSWERMIEFEVWDLA
jgi:hypothetical protein